MEKIGIVAYHLSLLDGFTDIHDVFHVSQLKRYNPNPEHVLIDEPLPLYPNLSYIEKPMKILEKSIKELRNKTILFFDFVGTPWNLRCNLGNRGMDDKEISKLILRYNKEQY
jgi:hypothetical protein